MDSARCLTNCLTNTPTTTTTTVTKPYAYQPVDASLRQIRLLAIQPGDWDDAICCSSSICSLDDHPIYQTLSYAWGDPHVTDPILLDGVEFPVTVNLESALRRLRKADDARIMWIDALCINQQDDVEKSEQVRLMSDIYFSCTQVFIWLGVQEPSDSDEESSETDEQSSSNGGHSLKPSHSSEHQSATASPSGSSTQHEDGDPRASFSDHTHTSASLLTGVVPPGYEGPGDYTAGHSHTRQLRVVKDSPDSPIEVLENAFDLIHEFACNKHILSLPCYKNGAPSFEDVPAFEKVWHHFETLTSLPWWNRTWTVQETVLPPKALVLWGSLSASWTMFTMASENYLRHQLSCCNVPPLPLRGASPATIADNCNSCFPR